MRILIIGGGPAGLYFGLLMKKQDPNHAVTLLERDGPNDTFGWGIVFSDQTFSYLHDSDRESFLRITDACETWDNVDVVHHGEKITIRGNRFSGIARIRFLNILHNRCWELGVDLRFGANFSNDVPFEAFDLVVGADGANSLVRNTHSAWFDPDVQPRRNKYIWLGTERLFHGLTLTFRDSDAGIFRAHSYMFSSTHSTFIVECRPETWERAGFEGMTDAETCRYLETVFAPDLEGKPLLTNNFVRWFNFLLVKNRRWHHDNVVLVGDALHTAHFSIGSGTKLALEDAISLAVACREHRDVGTALTVYESTRKPVIEAYQEAAYSSLLWFENVEEDFDLDPLPFAHKLMTRSGRITDEKLRRRDPAFVAAYDAYAKR